MKILLRNVMASMEKQDLGAGFLGNGLCDLGIAELRDIDNGDLRLFDVFNQVYQGRYAGLGFPRTAVKGSLIGQTITLGKIISGKRRPKNHFCAAPLCNNIAKGFVQRIELG